MRVRVLLLVGCLLGSVGAARAQFPAGGAFAYPVPVGGGAPAAGVVAYPLLAGGAAPAATGGPVHAVLVAEGGPPGSETFVNDPLVGPLFGDDLKVYLGFEYLRPSYSNRATTLVIPPGAGAAFPGGAALGDLTQDFAFIPRFGIEYMFPDTAGLGVGASGKLFTIQGDLRRTLTGSGGTGVLNAESTVTVGSANVLEGLVRVNLGRFDCFRDTFLEDLTVVGSVGGRYGYVRQEFTASLTSGPNLTSLTATQDFTGFGITGSVGTLYLTGPERRLGLYSISRGSVLAGRNNRSSTYSAVLAAAPSASGQVTDRVTRLIPVGEFEAGVSYGLPVRRRAPGAAPLPPLLWFRAGLVAQVWGGMGLLGPPVDASLGGGGAFRSSSLILYGFTVQTGVSF